MTVLCRQTLNPQGSGNSRHNNPIQVFFFFFKLQLFVFPAAVFHTASRLRSVTHSRCWILQIHSTWHKVYELINWFNLAEHWSETRGALSQTSGTC